MEKDMARTTLIKSMIIRCNWYEDVMKNGMRRPTAIRIAVVITCAFLPAALNILDDLTKNSAWFKDEYDPDDNKEENLRETS